MKILLRLSYIGTDFCGFQVQRNLPSIQGCIGDAAEKVFSVRPDVTGCSRTDAGVHAREFYCTLAFDGTPRVGASAVPKAMNFYLPRSISVTEAREVPDEFHPRYDAVGKEYEYLILNSPLRDPFLCGRAYEYPTRLDADLMRKAAAHFVGTHDFASFMSAGSGVKSTVRTIKYIDVCRDGDLIRIKICADGFLYNMVRIIVGTLICVSDGKIDESDIPEIIAKKDRAAAGPTVPAHGLYLNKVFYRFSEDL